MKDVLPAEVLNYPKAGFGAPINYWLREELRPFIEALLSEKQILSRGIFKPEAVQMMKREYFKGERDWSMQLWALLVLEIWQRVFIERANPWEEPSLASL
jgi:asparagine synthase (glutamine-hydrolysing)